MGQANRKIGRTKLVRPRPLENQTTISLSWYMRESTPTTATNRLSVRMVDMWLSTV